MATYTAAQTKGSGSLGEVLTGAKTLTITNHTGSTGTYPIGYLTLEGNPIANKNLSTLNPQVGTLIPGGILPFSSPNITTTVPALNSTFLFDVVGDTQGSGSVISLTSVNGVIKEGIVVETGSNFISGDVITISQNDIQAAGFTNANRSAILDIFPDKIDGNYIGTNMTGSFGTYANGIESGSLNQTNRRFSISIYGSGGSFIFTPSATIAVNSYYIKGVGSFDLTIS
tara:strand:+ start:2574 stop:3257 length:684 start_codon:yes stop_codon:yes gene_type:complete